MISGVTINTAAIDRTLQRLAGLANVTDKVTVEPLLTDLYRVIVEDNRYKVFNSIDRDGRPAPPLNYRMASKFQSAQFKGGLRGMQNPGQKGRFKGKAPERGRVLAHNNLTTAQYTQMTGPRLAPRRDSSRIIANLKLKRFFFNGGTWWVEAYWADVLTPKGFELLPFHFRNPDKRMRYNLAGVSARGVKEAQNVTRAYFLRLLKVFA